MKTRDKSHQSIRRGRHVHHRPPPASRFLVRRLDNKMKRHVNLNGEGAVFDTKCTMDSKASALHSAILEIITSSLSQDERAESSRTSSRPTTEPHHGCSNEHGPRWTTSTLVEIHRFHAHEFESRPTTARLDPIKQSSFLSEGSRMSFTTFAARAVPLYLNYPHQPQSKEKSCGFAALLPQVSTPLFCFHHRLSLPL